MATRHSYLPALDSDDEYDVVDDWHDDESTLVETFSAINLLDLPSSRRQSVSAHLCIVCRRRPRYNQKGKSYETCGLTCARKLALLGSAANSVQPLCVICKSRPAYKDCVTCGLSCLEDLCLKGGDPLMCTYCHRRPKIQGKKTCGPGCRRKAIVACLLCKSRPKHGSFYFCGRTCKGIAAKKAPLILEAVKGHNTYRMGAKRFQSSWKANSTTPPTPRTIFKYIGTQESLSRYEQYLSAVGNEKFCYHGTKLQCGLGTTTRQPCSSSSCPACNILKSSFKVSAAKATGAFGRGIYTSSASNKAYREYCGPKGALIVCKVALGKVKTVNRFKEVTRCPQGFNSVVFDRQNGKLNETVVYKDDAIRPVFLILF